MLIDTHAHVNFNAYKDDSDEVIRRSLAGGVWMINVGSQYTTSERAVMMAEKYPEGVYAAIGLHPIHLETDLIKVKVDEEEIEFKTREEEFDYEKYRNLAKSSKKIVAVGEIGFDYWYRPKTKVKISQFKEKQKQAFIQQLNLARELNLPVMLHCRMAHDDLLNVIKENIEQHGSKLISGVSHCFVGMLEQAKEYLKLGFCLGFNGIIFKKIPGLPDFEEIIKEVPLERILLETDCPYLTPEPMSGRNEPLYIKYIAEKIAKIKNISYQEVENQTTQNAKELFKI